MMENEIAVKVLDICFDIQRKLGPGLLESIYEEILKYELEAAGFNVLRQKSIPVVWNTLHLETGFRLDLIVEDKVILELKSVDALAPVHAKQVMTYLKLTGIKLGLLINFNENYLKTGVKRIVNHL